MQPTPKIAGVLLAMSLVAQSAGAAQAYTMKDLQHNLSERFRIFELNKAGKREDETEERQEKREPTQRAEAKELKITVV